MLLAVIQLTKMGCIYIYGFPKDPERIKKWTDQVKRTRDKWGLTAHSYLCSKNFEDDCFQPYSKLAEFLGVGKVRVLLKTGAIPTVFERLSNKRKISSLEPAAKKKREEQLWKSARDL